MLLIIREKISCLLVARMAVVLGVSVIFFWQASLAVRKYQSEPTSTTITYSKGDTPNGIVFPQVTMCDWDFTKNNVILNKCRNGSEHFITALTNCFDRDKHFSVSALNQSLQYDRKSFASNLSFIYDPIESVSLEKISEIVWYPIFHRRFGLCFTLDLSKHVDYKFVQFYKHPVAPALRLYFLANSHPWTWITLILHSEEDVADAMRSHPYFALKTFPKKNYAIYLTKKYIRRLSTKQNKCWYQRYETCRDNKDCNMIAMEYQCKISYFYTGPFMDTNCYSRCKYSYTLVFLIIFVTTSRSQKSVD